MGINPLIYISKIFESVYFFPLESRNPNCEVVELEDGSGALIAIHDLSAGDWLTVAYSDDEESRDEE